MNNVFLVWYKKPASFTGMVFATRRAAEKWMEFAKGEYEIEEKWPWDESTVERCIKNAN